MAKKPKIHPDAELVDRLGGPAEVSREVNKRVAKPISTQAVSMWRKRGVSVYFRNVFVELLRAKNIKIPSGFTASKHRGW